MNRLRLDDDVPGSRIETFCLPEGALIQIMRIASAAPAPAPRLFVRSEMDGRMFIAIEPVKRPATGSDG